VLETLITSKTRLKMLLKFFTNSHATAYLRGMADEFGESTNAIRHELNNLSKAGYLISNEQGRTILYRANTNHPLYNEVKSLIHKYLGLDKIIDNILRRIGDLQWAFIVGDYAKGIDSGTIEMVLVGKVDEKYLDKLAEKARNLIHRNIKIEVLSSGQYDLEKGRFATALVLWNSEISGTTALNKT
jgi:DNA-binding transcriptional ArsR family regulator